MCVYVCVCDGYVYNSVNGWKTSTMQRMCVMVMAQKGGNGNEPSRPLVLRRHEATKVPSTGVGTASSGAGRRDVEGEDRVWAAQ